MNHLSETSTINTDGLLTRILVYLYEQFSVNPLPKELNNIPKEFTDYIKFVYDKNNQDYPKINNYTNLITTNSIKSNNGVVLAFSGGKDSVASALYLKDRNVDLQLYYVKGINASYPNEEYSAKSIANILNLKLDIETIRFKGTKDFHENPVKNHLILASAIDKYYSEGYTKYSFGAMTKFTVDKCTIDYDLSDCTEFFRLFEDIIKKVYPDFELLLWWEDEGESNAYLNLRHPYILEHTQSCMMGLRYRESLKKRNENKYGIKLLPNRCGSCYKDAAEYMTMLYFGNIEPNKEYIKHCMSIFKNTWDIENPDKLSSSFYSNDEILNESIFKNKLKYYTDKYKLN